MAASITANGYTAAMLQFSYTAGEVYDAAWHQRRSDGWCRFVDRFIFAVVPAATSASLWPHLGDQVLGLVILLCGVLVWCAAAAWLHRPLSDVCAFFAFFSRYGTIPRAGKIQLNYSPGGISWRFSDQLIFTPWKDVARISIDAQYVFVHLFTGPFHWVPRRIFLSCDSVLRFVEECEEYRRLAVSRLPIDWHTLALTEERRRLREGMRKLGAEIHRLDLIVAKGDERRISTARLPSLPVPSTLVQESQSLRRNMDALGGQLSRLEELVGEPVYLPTVNQS